MIQDCYLAIENRRNDYTSLDTKDLETSENTSYFSLEQIDMFTMNYTKDTLAELIINSNVVNDDIDTLKNKLCVINRDNVKGKLKWRKYEVLSKEKMDNIANINDYLKYSLEDKDKTNEIYNILVKYAYEYKTELNNTLKNKNIESIMKFISSLDYKSERTVYLKLESLISKDLEFISKVNKNKNLKKQCNN
ncbi:MAG: hypothetical protein IJ574_00015 [Bacilli bacterium]|nr:hypothetical protein [Bacilli bacterium]